MNRSQATQKARAIADDLRDLILLAPIPQREQDELLARTQPLVLGIPMLWPLADEKKFKGSFMMRWQHARSMPDYNAQDWQRAAAIIGIRLTVDEAMGPEEPTKEN